MGPSSSDRDLVLRAQPTESMCALLRYWLQLRGDDDVPSRAKLDPVMQVPRLVANLALLRVAPPSPEFRVIGSHIVHWARRDLTGRRIDEETFPGDATRMCHQLSSIAQGRRPLAFSIGYGPLRLVARCTIGLPFAEPDRSVRDVLVGVFFDGLDRPVSARQPAATAAEIDVASLIAELQGQPSRE
ncbi:MAG: hypothetical protein JWM77_3431 [Rhodospirillales bacterium]|jgi:hypothetical protein|nr:hypothetical protein [Rhodospirillales bacterium]